MKHAPRGFTIVELLIVIVVIAILASITVVAYNGIKLRALASEFDSKSNTIVKSLLNFYSINDRYPSNAEIGGASGAALIGLNLNQVTTSETPDYHKSSGIMAGYADNTYPNRTLFRYMAIQNADGTGPACNTGICKTFSLEYWSPTANQKISIVRYG